MANRCLGILTKSTWVYFDRFLAHFVGFLAHLDGLLAELELILLRSRQSDELAAAPINLLKFELFQLVQYFLTVIRRKIYIAF
jgi:hypothetical protein